LTIGKEVLWFSGLDSEAGDEEEESKQLTPQQASYSDYIQGDLLFPSRVDLSDRNVPRQQRDADLAATIQKLAGIEDIMSVLSEGSSDAAERKSQVWASNER
jgi:hypothetical protein